MENERVIIATDSKTLKKVLSDFFNPISESNSVPDFEDDKLTQPQAAKLAGISIPTLKKEIRAGKFKEYELGRKRYLLKSELLKALRTTNL
ncbi:helix-turn-helix domain-containing protein [Prolixibacteraceae bacterium Z1-6]|uniref:Helix-turn-helix domain-containing protein n=1 Tax=Draconibacterium aestuarii TaxID=2998507 RepID=A0A9X3J5S4_9BACT|nr:helix-turn-helix domain-containing protein [Prolixibacteraceae bacterium Z1-6]